MQFDLTSKQVLWQDGGLPASLLEKSLHIFGYHLFVRLKTSLLPLLNMWIAVFDSSVGPGYLLTLLPVASLLLMWHQQHLGLCSCGVHNVVLLTLPP